MKKLLLSLLLLFPFAAAKADVIKTFNLTYSGAQWGNDATMTGTVTFNMTAMVAGMQDSISVYDGTHTSMGTGLGGMFGNTYDAVVQSLTLNVPGSGYGTGTFTKSDFDLFFLFVSNDAATGILPFNYIPGYGDQQLLTLAFWSSSAGAPSWDSAGTGTQMLGTGNLVTLTSIAPVPEPSSWVLGLGGLMGMTVLASRKKKSTASILKAPALVA